PSKLVLVGLEVQETVPAEIEKDHLLFVLLSTSICDVNDRLYRMVRFGSGNQTLGPGEEDPGVHRLVLVVCDAFHQPLLYEQAHRWGLSMVAKSSTVYWRTQVRVTNRIHLDEGGH